MAPRRLLLHPKSNHSVGTLFELRVLLCLTGTLAPALRQMLSALQGRFGPGSDIVLRACLEASKMCSRVHDLLAIRDLRLQGAEFTASIRKKNGAGQDIRLVCVDKWGGVVLIDLELKFIEGEGQGTFKNIGGACIDSWVDRACLRRRLSPVAPGIDWEEAQKPVFRQLTGSMYGDVYAEMLADFRDFVTAAGGTRSRAFKAIPAGSNVHAAATRIGSRYVQGIGLALLDTFEEMESGLRTTTLNAMMDSVCPSEGTLYGVSNSAGGSLTWGHPKVRRAAGASLVLERTPGSGENSTRAGLGMLLSAVDALGNKRLVARLQVACTNKFGVSPFTIRFF